MPGDFSARMDELAARVGSGTLTAKVEFDQVYAHRQHEDMSYRHTGGGGALYLQRALFEGQPVFMELIANSVLRETPIGGMILVAESLASKAQDNAPVRTGKPGTNILRRSAHPTVEDNGDIVYDRPAIAPRLTEHEIELRNTVLQDPNHYYGPWPPVLTSTGRVGIGRRRA